MKFQIGRRLVHRSAPNFIYKVTSSSFIQSLHSESNRIIGQDYGKKLVTNSTKESKISTTTVIQAMRL